MGIAGGINSNIIFDNSMIKYSCVEQKLHLRKDVNFQERANFYICCMFTESILIFVLFFIW